MRFLIIVLAFFILNPIYSQLVIDIGEEGIVCSDEWTTTPDTLGGNPTVLEGSGHYSYCWETYYEFGFSTKYKYYASDLLDDTTKANPIVINSPTQISVLTFYLTVYDSIQNLTVRDSIKVFLSRPTYTLLDLTFWVQDDNEPIKIGNNFVSLSFPIEEYCWYPATFLNDSTTETPSVQATDDIEYSLKITDSIGCTASVTDVVRIRMLRTSLSTNISKEEFCLYQNPSTKTSFVHCKSCSGSYTIRVFDSHGTLCYKKDFTGSTFELIENYEGKRLNFYVITENYSVISTGSFIN